MKLLILEPYFTGSHALWAKGYQESSQFSVDLLTLPGKFWKWRMNGGAITLAKKYLEKKPKPDVILASDMLNLPTFQALTRSQTSFIPFLLYFHENQITYPWSPGDRDRASGRDKHYGFINFTSALSSHFNLFNSNYHKESFLESLPGFLKRFPDENELECVIKIAEKSQVLPLGLNLKKFDDYKDQIYDFKKQKNIKKPLILWNHRWEYDKNPKEFFQLLVVLQEKGMDFELAILGESFGHQPKEFEKAKKNFSDKIRHWGYVKDLDEYAKWLWAAHLAPVTSFQEFFGTSFIEAIYCNCSPLLPNRLTYPEILPKETHKDFIYHSFDDLVEKSMAILQNEKPDPNIELPKHVRQFDWEKMAPYYDQTISKLVEEIKT